MRLFVCLENWDWLLTCGMASSEQVSCDGEAALFTCPASLYLPCVQFAHELCAWASQGEEPGHI